MSNGVSVPPQYASGRGSTLREGGMIILSGPRGASIGLFGLLKLTTSATVALLVTVIA